MIQRGRVPQHALIQPPLLRVGRDLLGQIEPHRQVMQIDLGVNRPVPAAENIQPVKDRNDGGIEIERDPFAEQIERDDLHIVQVAQCASLAE